MSSLQSLKYETGSLQIIDQLKLPNELEYIPVNSSEDAWSVIRTMQVRGAPLIAIVAVLGLAVDIYNKKDEFTSIGQVQSYLLHKIDYLRTSRPTAVNLFTATDELKDLIIKSSNENISKEALIDIYIKAAEEIYHKDIITNQSIGSYGAKQIIETTKRDKIRILTICNTGSLATAGYGTALGVVRALHNLDKLEQVYALETRPYNQGARLTSFEIVHDNLPGTLITDSMASFLIATKGIDAVVVGADRVTANGDTANKIGTYQLAIVAKYHNIPFYTAVPTTSIDLKLANGKQIHIEERPADELTKIFGQNIAPNGINVWNPAFDVTPASLITGIITELGIASATTNDPIIDLTTFLKSKGISEDKLVGAITPTYVPDNYQRLDENKISDYIIKIPKLVDILGIDLLTFTNNLIIKEVGDGNLNYVYIITNPSNNKQLVIKQALPWVRCVGESWPLTLDRAYYEYNALVEERKHAINYVPEVYHFDKINSLIAMQFIPPPNIILRYILINGVKVNTFAKDIGIFLSNTLFHTSNIYLSGSEVRLNISKYTNVSMCGLTEQVIFTDPYQKDAQYNHWTSPQLDDIIHNDIMNNTILKISINKLKEKFINQGQALLHGDLHTGSVMASEGTTYVIDPEFAFYGPIGFDIAAILSNLLLNYFAQKGLDSNRDEYADWVLDQAIILYNEFKSNFINLWNTNSSRGEIYSSKVFPSIESFQLAQDHYLNQIWIDTLGFIGAKVIRRIVGIAHVADIEKISDVTIKASIEKKALKFASYIVVQSQYYNDIHTIDSIEKLAQYAKEINKEV